MTSLEQLAADPRVNGIVLPVETDPAVQDAYEDWDAQYCYVNAANDVAEAVRDLVQKYVNDPDNDIQYVVIAGVDSVIPFYRVQDEVAISNESDFFEGAETDANNPLYYALEGGVIDEGGVITRYGFISTDDIYTDDNPLGFKGHELFVPDRASGRLVETPDQIMSTIGNYLGNGSVVVNNSLVTGYDFLTDSGVKINSVLGDLGANSSSLLSQDWTAGDLASNWPNASSIPELVSVNAHFEQWLALPADPTASSENPLDLFYNTDILAGDVSNQVAYSMGCHAGLSVFDEFVDIPGNTDL